MEDTSQSVKTFEHEDYTTLIQLNNSKVFKVQRKEDNVLYYLVIICLTLVNLRYESTKSGQNRGHDRSQRR